PMYPRLDENAQRKILEELVPGDVVASAPATPAKAAAKPEPAKADAPASTHITYDDFAKLELRVGKVIEAIAVPKKDKLLHLQVDLGEGKPRSIVAGIAQAYKPEQM